MPRIKKGRNRILAENGLEFLGRQRLFRVIAFDQIIGILFAQETPRVPAGRSGAFVPEIVFAHSSGRINHGETKSTKKNRESLIR
jgi:hypothetical protein